MSATSMPFRMRIREPLLWKETAVEDLYAKRDHWNFITSISFTILLNNPEVSQIGLAHLLAKSTSNPLGFQLVVAEFARRIIRMLVITKVALGRRMSLGSLEGKAVICHHGVSIWRFNPFFFSKWYANANPGCGTSIGAGNGDIEIGIDPVILIMLNQRMLIRETTRSVFPKELKVRMSLSVYFHDLVEYRFEFLNVMSLCFGVNHLHNLLVRKLPPRVHNIVPRLQSKPAVIANGVDDAGLSLHSTFRGVQV